MHYKNTPMQKYSDFCFHIKNENISGKVMIFSLFLLRGGSNEYPQSMFWTKNKKKSYTPAYPVLPYKNRVEGGIHCTDMFPDGKHDQDGRHVHIW